MDAQKTLTFHIRRYTLGSGEEPKLASFVVPYQVGMSVMDALHYAKNNLDSSLAFDCSCRIGICKACAVRMDGKAVMACSTVACDGMCLEPVNTKDVKRDLIVRPITHHATVAEILSSLSAPDVQQSEKV